MTLIIYQYKNGINVIILFIFFTLFQFRAQTIWLGTFFLNFSCAEMNEELNKLLSFGK